MKKTNFNLGVVLCLITAVVSMFAMCLCDYANINLEGLFSFTLLFSIVGIIVSMLEFKS